MAGWWVARKEIDRPRGFNQWGMGGPGWTCLARGPLYAYWWSLEQRFIRVTRHEPYRYWVCFLRRREGAATPF